MQIRVSTGDCRAAVAAAVALHQGKFDEDRKRIWAETYQRLREGAEHNGLVVTEERATEMRGMVDRDIDHMFAQHPAVETIAVLKNFEDMLAYHNSGDIVIDDQDFHLLKAHLPAQSSAS